MAANLKNTLYPPQVSTFQPAFVYDQDVNVYFSLSQYNDSTLIQRVHVTLVSQETNENVFKNCPSGVMIYPLTFDTEKGMYYITISPTVIEGGHLNINQMYKMQIRLDSFEGTANDQYTDNQRDRMSYLLSHQEYFSEWSQVTLLRPILQPSILLRTFDTSNASKVSVHKGIVPIAGKMFFGDNTKNETETMQSYYFNVYKQGQLDEPILTTKNIYTGDNIDPNVINYYLDLQVLDTAATTQFVLEIVATTRNQYVLTQTWDFVISEYIDIENFNPTLSVELDNDNGIVKIHIENPMAVYGIIHLRRTSSLVDYKQWETVQQIKVKDYVDTYVLDPTVGSLVWYKYSIQLENLKGGMSSVYESEKIFPEFYDAIISRENQQLKIKYNYQVSNLKPVVNRSKIDTLGGKYPKFAENAIMNYKQFAISGSLSAMNDDEELFLNQEAYFGRDYMNFLIVNEAEHDIVEYTDKNGNKRQYINYRQMGYSDGDDSTRGQFYLTQEAYNKNDFLWEREFREAALAWLNDGEPKLYRSMPEGTMAVMFTDVTITPNKTVGRRMWDFSATVYEVGDGTNLDSLNSLGIYTVNYVANDGSNSGYDTNIPENSTLVKKPGQVYTFTVNDKNNIISYKIASDLQVRYSGKFKDYAPKDCYLKNVKIYFHSKPNTYLQTDRNNIQLVTDVSSYPESIQKQMQLGYLFSVQTGSNRGDSTIFVNEKGYYQLPNNLDITALYFPHIGDIITLEYVVVYKEVEDSHLVVSNAAVERVVVGQERGIFKPNRYLGTRIRQKYNYIKTDEYYDKMKNWKGICLDVDPFALAHVKYKQNSEYNDYLVGQTGVLHMLKDAAVEDLCFRGRRMKRRRIKPLYNKETGAIIEPGHTVQKGWERQPWLEDWEFIVENESRYDNEEEIIAVNYYWKDFAHQDLGIVRFDFDGELLDLGQEEWITSRSPEDGDYLSVDEIENPQLNMVYSVGAGYKIYYRYGWYDFQPTGSQIALALVPIEGDINYYGDVVRYEY